MTIVLFMGMILIDGLIEGAMEYRAAVKRSGYHRTLSRRPL